MAEQPAVAEAPVEEKKKSKKLILILAVVGLLAGGGAAYFLGFIGGGDEAEEVAEEPEVVEGMIVDVATMTTNVGGGAPGYVRVGLAAVLAEGFTPDLVADRYPLLKDATLSEVATFKKAQLESPKGMDKLRGALTARAQEIWPEGEVVRIVLTELLVQ